MTFSAGAYHLAVITKDGKLLTSGESGQSKLGRSGDGYQFSKCDLPDEIERPISVACGGSVSFVICGLTSNVAVTGTGTKGQLGLGSIRLDTNDSFQILPNVKLRHIAAGSTSNSAVCATSGVLYVWGSANDRVLGKIRQNIFAPRPVKLPHQGQS